MTEPGQPDDDSIDALVGKIYWTAVQPKFITGVPPGQPLDKPVYKLREWGSRGWHYTRPAMAIGLFQIRDVDAYAPSEEAAKAACAEDALLLNRYQGWLEFMANNPPPQ